MEMQAASILGFEMDDFGGRFSCYRRDLTQLNDFAFGLCKFDFSMAMAS